MNRSDVQDVSEISCQMFGTAHFVITKIPSKHLLLNQVFGILCNSILMIPTILLNGIAVKTILKSSQLSSKPCYFIILLQSLVDLVVGVMSIPLFIFYVASGIGGFSNCYVAALALRLILLPIGLSKITLTAMTLQRYIAIVHPYVHRTQVTIKRVLIFVAFNCAGVIIFFFAPQTAKEAAGAVVITLVLLFNTLAYTKIYMVIRTAARSRNQVRDSASEDKFTKLKLFLQNIKQAKSSFIVVICFFVLVFLPAAIAGPFYATVDKFEQLAILVWIYTLSYSNSSVNSVIFFWAHPLLKKDALKMLKNMNLC